MYYRKPTLTDLSLGARLKFIRKHRHMQKEDVAGYFGYGGDDPTQTIRKHENNTRKPEPKRMNDYIELFEVSSYALKEYDFEDPTDFIYVQMWMEEEFPNYDCIIDPNNFYGTEYNVNIINGLLEWKNMREKRKNGEISLEGYIDWKLNFEIKKSTV